MSFISTFHHMLLFYNLQTENLSSNLATPKIGGPMWPHSSYSLKLSNTKAELHTHLYCNHFLITDLVQCTYHWLVDIHHSNCSCNFPQYLCTSDHKGLCRIHRYLTQNNVQYQHVLQIYSPTYTL